MSGFEGVGNVVQDRAFSGSGGDAYDIESDGDVVGEVRLGIGVGELDQLSLLFGVDGIHGGEMVVTGTGFDLDDDHGIAVLGYDVDFAEAAAPAALENLVAASS